jgi:predicted nucleic acid-binding protein
MAASLSAKRLALDTNVLFDLANDAQFAHGFREVFQRLGFSLEVPPRVISELVRFRANGNDLEQAAASRALHSMRALWGLEPIMLRDVEQKYKKNFIIDAEDAAILPPREVNDLHILAETSIAGIQGLVTSDGPLLNADPIQLQLAFQNAGLNHVTPVHPRKLCEIPAMINVRDCQFTLVFCHALCQLPIEGDKSL